MAAFASDTFTDTNGVALDSHTPSGGGTWAKAEGSEVGEIQNNKFCARNNTGRGLYYHSATPPSADYGVTAVNYWVAAGTGPLLCARMATAAATCYLAYWSGSGYWYIGRFNAGTATQLNATNPPTNSPAGGSGIGTVELRVSGTGATVTVALLLDGSEVLSNGVTVTDTAAGRITDVGKAGVGVYYSDAGWGRSFESWSAEEVAGTPPASTFVPRIIMLS